VIGRIVISDVEPVLDCGRRPAKAVVGETFEVSATVFREGHEVPGAGVVLRGPEGVPTHCSLFARVPGDWKYDWRRFADGCRAARGGEVVLRIDREGDGFA